MAGTVREVIKTTKYKHIQRIYERNGVFGLNTECLGGTYSTAVGTSLKGIPISQFSAYRSLLT